MIPHSPVTEDDLHALVDDQLEASRLPEVDAYLRKHPDAACRVAGWIIQRRQLRALFPLLSNEPLPEKMEQAALPKRRWMPQQIAAGVLIAITAGALGWGAHDGGKHATPTYMAASSSEATELVQHAAMAHAVYAADLRRPVEIAAAHEDQLVTWLSKRMGAQMKPPKLQALGYHLEGGRLLPGRSGPVAQFMYENGAGMRLTLYVAHEAPAAVSARNSGRPETTTTAFQFAQDGPINVFYWIDGSFGYAISSYGGRTELANISAAVYRQLAPGIAAQVPNAKGNPP
ncbi:MAG: anti-sigma factor [Castellaniella sp.]|uniref:anti-sigma factor family protein n=1 Tax=Castellaniella sp. TaxID=1955812 RepID=UPI0012057E29|nr:anti-sigma factor [Castellaniella sp.]TAN28283.1 MAG: anti-sigma factor [Castellaniella sp.]